jgi:hypothetical protein
MANTCCELFSSWNSLLGVGQAFGTLHLADSDLEQVMSSAWVKAYPGMAGRNWSASYPLLQRGSVPAGLRRDAPPPDFHEPRQPPEGDAGTEWFL